MVAEYGVSSRRPLWICLQLLLGRHFPLISIVTARAYSFFSSISSVPSGLICPARVRSGDTSGEVEDEFGVVGGLLQTGVGRAGVVVLVVGLASQDFAVFVRRTVGELLLASQTTPKSVMGADAARSSARLSRSIAGNKSSFLSFPCALGFSVI